MDINEDILEFSKFLDSYRDKYAKPSSEISLPKPQDREDYYENEKLYPLVNSDYIMLDFDSICADANFFPKESENECNQPSTVDALYYRIKNENKIEFFMVEFKSFFFDWDKDIDYNASITKVIDKLEEGHIDRRTQSGINRLKKIKDTYGNTIEFSLRLKPYESLFVVLPKIYDEYCEEQNIPDEKKINLYEFFKSELCDILLIVVGKRKGNLSKAYNGKLGSILNKQYQRLEYVNVLKHHNNKLCFNSDFSKVTRSLTKNESKTIKSLNKENKLS